MFLSFFQCKGLWLKLQGMGWGEKPNQNYLHTRDENNWTTLVFRICWQLSEGCHSFLRRVTRTGWNWFEAVQLLNTMQLLRWLPPALPSWHQKQRILQNRYRPLTICECTLLDTQLWYVATITVIKVSVYVCAYLQWLITLAGSYL